MNLTTNNIIEKIIQSQEDRYNKIILTHQKELDNIKTLKDKQSSLTKNIEKRKENSTK